MSTDPLTMIMGSRGFAGVARAVLFAMIDPGDETGATRLLGIAKNNLGRTDLPTLKFTIVSAKVAETDEGPINTGRIEWTGETTRSLTDTIEAGERGREHRSAVQEAADWLTDWLRSQGSTDESANIKREGHKAGHSDNALKRARRAIKAESHAQGFPRRTWWSLPGAQSGQESRAPLGERGPVEPTSPTKAVGPVGAVGAHPPGAQPTDDRPFCDRCGVDLTPGNDAGNGRCGTCDAFNPPKAAAF